MRVALFSVLLFFSGVSALIFQTLWLRLSGLVFGNSVWSAALILSSFMAGLAIGSAIAAKIRLVKLRPLRLYILLEVAIAVSGCSIVLGLPSLGQWLRPVFESLSNHDVLLNVLRLVFSFIILLVPTTAMGLTLPILLGDQVSKRYDFGRLTGFFYGTNTLGAVAGAIIGEAWLVRAVGIWGTGLCAAGLNFAAALIAFLLTRVDRDLEASAPEKSDLRAAGSGRLPWPLVLTSFVSGGLLLALEVVWFRFLRLYVASSATGFAIMLAVVLAGIGAGGIVSGFVRHRTASSNMVIPILLMSSAIVSLLCYVFFPLPALSSRFENYYFESWREIALPCLFLMFPVAFLSGMLFPQIIAEVQKGIGDRIRSAGITTLLNTVGATLGPLLASFVLLPAVGFQTSLLLCAGAYAALALTQISPVTSIRGGLSNATVFGLAVVFVSTLVFFPYGRDEQHFANARRAYEAVGEQLEKRVEGNSDTYQLLRRDIYGEPYYYRLAANAFSLANTESRNQRYMRLFAYLPLFLNPDSKEALLICYGCGVTADALTHFPGLHRIDIVDISKEVIALAPYYAGRNEPNALRDPRVTTVIQDGRFFLQASPRRYDLITGEPPPPKVAGIVNLYTQEFFALMKGRLNESGVVSFWLPIAQLKVDESKAILRAFHNVFATAGVWASGDNEWIMVGINGPGRRLSENECRSLWTNPATGDDLRRIGVELPEQVGALFLMDGDEIDRLTNNSNPLTDSFPKRLSDDPPDRENVRDFAWRYLEAPVAFRAFRTSSFIQRIWPEGMKAGLESLFVVRESRYLSEVAVGSSNKLAELDLYLRHSKLRGPVLEALRTDEFRLAIAKAKTTGMDTVAPEFLSDLTADALGQRDFPRAIQLLDDKKQRGLAVQNDIFLLIYLNCLAGRVDTAEALARELGASRKDWLVDWLWGKLQAEFGFRPPAESF